jgi:hypothetical protein
MIADRDFLNGCWHFPGELIGFGHGMELEFFGGMLFRI